MIIWLCPSVVRNVSFKRSLDLGTKIVILLGQLFASYIYASSALQGIAVTDKPMQAMVTTTL